jgi:CHDNT (NUC034) domain.
MPTVEEVCMTFGLTDVDVEYTEADFQNLTTYKLFQQHVRPMLGKENPKVKKYIFNLCDFLIVL